MLANPYTKFTPFEKKALCAFGCTDQETTINNLHTVATIAQQRETAVRFDRLIAKLQRDVFPNNNYEEVFYACAAEQEASNVKEVLDYQEATGDVTTGRPWRNYGKAGLVNEFCDDEPYTTIGRLLFLREAATLPEVRTLVEEVQREVENFYRTDTDTFVGYDKWLAWHRDIVHSGKSKKRKSKKQFREFKWAVPSYGSKETCHIEAPSNSGDFLNSVPGAMEKFVPELATEIEKEIKADQESDHPSPDKCVNISITTEQLVRLINGIRETKQKMADAHWHNNGIS